MTFQDAHIGMRVVMTAHARKQGMAGRFNRIFGTIKGYGRKDPGLIRVQRDGEKHTNTYSPKFWEPIQ